VNGVRLSSSPTALIAVLVLLGIPPSPEPRESGAVQRTAADLHIYTNVDVNVVRRGTRGFSPDITIETGSARELTARLRQIPHDIDVVLIEGVAYLEEAYAAKLIRQFESASMRQSIPFPLRSRSRGWFTVSYVARGVVFPLNRAAPDRLVSVWSAPLAPGTGAACLPPSGQLRSQAMVADAIRVLGPQAESVVKSWVQAAGAQISRNELELIRAVANGECDLGFAHSDVIAQNADLKFRLRVSWPEDNGAGTPILATGIAMTTRTANYDRALAFLDWIASKDAQRAWTATTLAFPANQFVPPPEPVLALGKIRVDLSSPQATAVVLAEAQTLSMRVGYR
jgi:iron(III) transport system substrate-binding protein